MYHTGTRNTAGKEEMLNRLSLYLQLIRIDKPVGILLLLWPTLSALWIASGGVPQLSLLVIFVLGTILMRSAGCAVNDFADRHFDGYVKRTADRPLVSGKLKPAEAIWVAVVLSVLAFLLILPLNGLVIGLSFAALVIAATYPFFKRFFALPQAYLGIAFGFGIPMAFAAVLNHVPPVAWLLLLGNVFWTLAYDTEYAMVDRDDDLKIGIRTSAITFGRFDVLAVMVCYSMMLLTVLLAGWHKNLGVGFLAGCGAALCCIFYHYRLIRNRDRQRCFQAFCHNNWVGAFIFGGIVLDYALR